MTFSRDSDVRVPNKEYLENMVDDVEGSIKKLCKVVGSNFELTQTIDRLQFDLKNVFLGLNLCLPRDKLRAKEAIEDIAIRVASVIRK